MRTSDDRVSALRIPAVDPQDGDGYLNIYTWAHRQTDAPTDVADRVARVAVALVRNAHQWTRSGQPGGHATLEIVRGRFDIAVSVTDEGTTPSPAGTHTFPVATPHTGGLHTVDALALYWDWDGGAGTPITVRALIDRRTF
ncbi:ATP-binding protein [Nocardiopsis sp. N85]|uniref:ATP-binding protein n=1 Tax=Nocardiopsis sp. N85 TaxID=3029400 RepID=UPI00237F8A81|nr:ATP-binding protein [Nocardiopsis sp. N85]MDE3721865.1 ATP-binding protein [Nocardiopsis sp. N85]